MESLLLNDKTRRLSIDELAEAAGGETGYWHYIEGYGKEYVWECNFCEN